MRASFPNRVRYHDGHSSSMLNRLLLLSVSELICFHPDLAAVVKQVTVLFPRAVVPHKVCQQCVEFECTFTTACSSCHQCL